MKTAIHKIKPIRIKGPVALLPLKEYESLLETLEILSDRKQVLRIEAALRSTQKGKTYTHKEVFGHDQR